MKRHAAEPSGLEVPARTRARLETFRRQLWGVKLAEALLAATFGVIASYLLVFVLDRLWDTPAPLRALLLVGSAMGFAMGVPLQWYRWIWLTRGLVPLARLLRQTYPRFGERLLGIVELAQNLQEQGRSPALCRAAMKQVDEDPQLPDFSRAIPRPRHRHWAWAAGLAMMLSLIVGFLVPQAGGNALVRWLAPWRSTERYTFAQLRALPNQLRIPAAEPFEMEA